jgi:carboxymethylenebutenolidase
MSTRNEILTHTAEIDVRDGTRMGGYVARPIIEGDRAGVIVAGELFGMSAHVRDVCERLAGLGYRVLAPDLYHRIAPGVELPHDAEGREQGMRLLSQMRRGEVLDDVRAAAEYLRSQGSQRIAILGLSIGGHVAYLAAAELDLAAAIVLYGGWIPTTDIPLSQPEPTIARTASITARILILVGEDDHIVTPEQRRAIAQTLDAAGVRHELIEYPRAPHGFLCDRRDTYQPTAASDAWSRIEALLRAELQ